MTDLLGGRLRVALSCGAASCALLSLSAAQGQDTTVAAPRTTPVVLAADGDVTVTAEGTITLDGEAADTTAISVSGAPSGDISVAGAISIASGVVTDANEQPASFPQGRFGLLIGQDDSLTGDVTFEEGSTLVVDTANGAGIGLFGALDGTLSVAGGISVEGDNSAAIRVAGPVSGDVIVAAVPVVGGDGPAGIDARGIGTHGVDVSGDVSGQLSIGRFIQTRVFTSALLDDGADPDTDEQLDAEEQAALVGGNALRVTGDVGGGIVLTAPVAAVVATTDTPAQAARTGGALLSEGQSAALFIGGGAQIGAGTDDPDTDIDESFGLINGGTITGTGGVTGPSARAILVDDATIAGGFLNQVGADVTVQAGGQDATAIAVEFTQAADVGSVINQGTVTATLASQSGDAIAFVDRAGAVTSFTNEGSITASVVGFGEAVDGVAPVPAGSPVAVDLSANTSGVAFDNSGSIGGAVLLGSGDDTLSSQGFLGGDVSTGAGNDTISLDGSGGFGTGFLIGDVSTGTGDDTILISNGGLIGQLNIAGATPGGIDFGDGFDTLTITGAGSQAVNQVDFGGGGGALTISDGGSFQGSLQQADDVDLTVGGNGSLLRLLSDVSTVGSLTTLAGETVTQGDMTTTQAPATLSFQVDATGQTVSSLNVLGDATIASDTIFRTEFQAAFADDLTAPILSAGGTLDIDLQDPDARLDTDGAVPFLFSQALVLSEDGQSVLLQLERRSAEEVGLDPIRAAAYEPFIAALAAANNPFTNEDGTVSEADPDVGQAIFNIGATAEQTGQERFAEAFDQFLPGPLDAPLTYARAQTNSVTSLVTQRITQLRETPTRQRRVWLQESSYFVNQDTTVEGGPGYDGGGFVIAIGGDAPLGPIDTVGISASIATARYDEETGEDFPFDRLTYNFGAYAAESVGPLQFDGRAAFGFSNSQARRNVLIVARDELGRATGDGDINRLTSASWDGTQLTGYARALYAGELGAWDVQPFASVDYIRISEDPFQETGDQVRAVALSADEREAESLRGNVGVIIGREFQTRPSRFDTSIPATVAPRLTVAYSDELSSDPLEATFRFEGGEDFVLTEEKPGGAAILGADIAYENEYARLGLGISATASEETQIYGLRVGVGLKW